MKALNLNRLNIRTPYSVWAVDTMLPLSFSLKIHILIR